MECKDNGIKGAEGGTHVEIDTLWNVKRINIFVIRYPASVEIDTLWNVKVGDRTDQMGHGRVEIDTLWNVKRSPSFSSR